MNPADYSIEGLVCDESFQAYCLGMTEKDRIYWQNWERQHPQQRQAVAAAKRLIMALSARQGSRAEQLAALKDALDRQTALRDMLQGAETDQAAEESSAAGDLENAGKNRTRSLLLKIAAVVTLALGLGYGVMYCLMPGDKAHQSGSLPLDYYTREAHKTVLLPDSSIVVLNKNSHLHIDKDFTATHRVVAVSGEGYFDIKHDGRHPFTVKTSDYNIRVLGTVFNVRAYPKEKVTSTALIRGKVEITGARGGTGAATKSIILKPEQKFVLAHIAAKSVQQASPSIDSGWTAAVVKMQSAGFSGGPQETAWARKKIQVSNMRLSQIAAELEKWYGVEITVDPAVADNRYTGTFEDETVTNVLDMLQASYPFSYELNGNKISIQAAVVGK